MSCPMVEATCLEQESRRKIAAGRQQNRRPRRQNPGRHHGGNGVRGIVEPVQKSNTSATAITQITRISWPSIRTPAISWRSTRVPDYIELPPCFVLKSNGSADGPREATRLQAHARPPHTLLSEELRPYFVISPVLTVGSFGPIQVGFALTRGGGNVKNSSQFRNYITMEPMEDKKTARRIFEMQCEICKALAHPLRLAIVDRLSGREAAAPTDRGAGDLKGEPLEAYVAARPQRLSNPARRPADLLRLTDPEIHQACAIMRSILYRASKRG